MPHPRSVPHLYAEEIARAFWDPDMELKQDWDPTLEVFEVKEKAYRHGVCGPPDVQAVLAYDTAGLCLVLRNGAACQRRVGRLQPKRGSPKVRRGFVVILLWLSLPY